MTRGWADLCLLPTPRPPPRTPPSAQNTRKTSPAPSYPVPNRRRVPRARAAAANTERPLAERTSWRRSCKARPLGVRTPRAPPLSTCTARPRPATNPGTRSSHLPPPPPPLETITALPETITSLPPWSVETTTVIE